MSSIVLFGNGAAAINVVETLTTKSNNTLAVVVDPNDRGKDTWQPSLKKFCKEKSIHTIQVSSFSSKSFITTLTLLEPNIMLSVQCRKILPQKIINIVNGEIFNMHFALLPKMRGCYPVFWHIRNGDSHGGVTLHKLTAGIDEGAIIAQKKIPITTTTTTKLLYDTCAKVCPSLLMAHLKSLINRSYRLSEQNNTQATYYSIKSVDFSQYYIDWNKPTQEVARFIQAFTFPPLQCAHSRVQGKELEVTQVLSVQKKPPKYQPGTVIRSNKNYLHIQTLDGIVSVRYKYPRPIQVGTLFYI